MTTFEHELLTHFPAKIKCEYVNILIKSLRRFVESVDETTVDKSSLKHLLEGCVHVHSPSAQHWSGCNFTKRYKEKVDILFTSET